MKRLIGALRGPSNPQERVKDLWFHNALVSILLLAGLLYFVGTSYAFSH